MNHLVQQYHDVIAASIDRDGVWPHQCLDRRAGVLSMSAIALRDPQQVYQVLRARVFSERPDELVYGLDRFCRPGQGTTLGDCIAGAYWGGAGWNPFIIEYQHEPRIVKPVFFGNATWNDFITRELCGSGLGSAFGVPRPQEGPVMRAEFREIVHGWMLTNELEALSARIERASAWARLHDPLMPDEEATLKMMRDAQLVRGIVRQGVQ